MDLQKTYLILNKIKLIIEKLETSNYVMNHYYADAYINKISDDTDPEMSLFYTLPMASYLTDMLSGVLIRCENYHISVRVFFTRILAVVSAKELNFVQVFTQIGDHINKWFKSIHSTNMSESLRVAYLEVALSLIKHPSGMIWLLDKGVWKDILMMVDGKRTVYVMRHVHKFISKFMWTLNDIGDVTNMNVALNFILAPIQEHGLINLNSINDEYETEMCKKLEPICQMLLAILSEKDRIQTSNKLMNSLLTEHFIIDKMEICINRLQSEEIILLCAKVSCWAKFGIIFQSKPLVAGVVYTKDDLLGLSGFYYNTLRLFLQKRSTKLVLEFSTACSMIWNIAWQNSSPFLKDNDKNLEMQSQIAFLCALPLIVWITKERDYTEFMEDELVVKNIKALMNNANVEQTMRAVYSLRSLLYEIDIMPSIMICVKMLTCMKTHYTDEVATLTFQCLFFILRDFNYDECISHEPESSKSEKMMALSHIMEILLSLVKHYNITWNESLEVLNVYSVVHAILKKPNLPPKFVVVSLTVLAFSVKKFLTPNLSLLLESTPGSAAHEIGPLIHHKMSDTHWEVRDSALELLFVCTDISYIKFPPFQKQIIKERLINVAAALAFNDSETYVQASALKCLGAATRVPGIWEQLKMEYPNIQDQLLSILKMNPDGIVRKEACGVLCEIYQRVKMTAAAKHILYEHMVSTALSDFHWEVQISALKFWRMVIKTLLTDQGMLDGTFPPVTFSRESRKIVTLNAAEIQRRLLKVLDELSSIGCLTVLVKLLNEDSEAEIMELALNISLELLEILDNYKLPQCLKPNDGDASLEELTFHITDVEEIDILPSTSEVENVIDGILKSDDVNLLANIYERQMSIDPTSESQIKPKLSLVKSASPNLFVDYVKSKDFKAILKDKKQWKEGVHSLSSLLDDLLGYEVQEDVNVLDCY